MSNTDNKYGPSFGARRTLRRVAGLTLVGVAVAIAAFIQTAGNSTGLHYFRNLVPVLASAALFAFTLLARPGDVRWWLAGAGFALPAVGLSVYLHLAFLLDWRELASTALTPSRLFAWLPVYAVGAGAIGFCIGWLIGRNVHEHRARH